MNVKMPPRSVGGRPCGGKEEGTGWPFLLMCCSAGMGALLPTTLVLGSLPSRIPSVAGARAASPTPRTRGSLLVSVSCVVFLFFFSFFCHIGRNVTQVSYPVLYV